MTKKPNFEIEVSTRNRENNIIDNDNHVSYTLQNSLSLFFNADDEHRDKYYSKEPTMATLLPPPKRQKIYHGNAAPEPEITAPTSNVVVQFVSEEDGSPLAPAVQIPANVSREGLEALVNKLSNQV